MKRSLYVSMLVMFVIALTSIASAWDNPSTINQNTGSIQGIVSDVSTGDPIAGASVGVAGNGSYDSENSASHAETDSTGYYILNGVSAGSTVINVEKDGYEFANQGVLVVANDTIETDISLTPVPPPPPPPPPPAQGSISGTVTDASTGSPIAGASVSVTSNGAHDDSHGWSWAKTSTDSNGNYLLTGVSAGTTLVYAQAQGYLVGYQSVGVIANGTTIANISLTAIVQPSKGSVQGTVTDATTGLPITGAYVYAHSSSQSGNGQGDDGPDCNNGGSQYAKTDSTGFYTLSNLNAGDYNIIASDNGYQSQTQTATVTGNNTTIVNFALQSQVTTTGSITGTVSDASTGNPIVGASVFVSIGAENWYGNLGYLKAQTDSTGTYEIDGVPSGDQVVKASACGYDYSVQTVTIPANDTAIANFALNPTTPPPTGTITGTVSDASTGLPLAGVKVSVREDFDSRSFGPRDNVLFATTDANGAYSIYSVSTGTLYVIAIDSGYICSKQQGVVLDGQTTEIDFSLTPYGQGSTITTVQVNVNNPWNIRIANIPSDNFIAFVPVSDQVLPTSWKLLL